MLLVELHHRLLEWLGKVLELLRAYLHVPNADKVGSKRPKYLRQLLQDGLLFIASLLKGLLNLCPRKPFEQIADLQSRNDLEHVLWGAPEQASIQHLGQLICDIKVLALL